MIVFTDIEKIYPMRKTSAVTAVTGINLEIERGEFVIIVGRSGSGKTTILNLAGGLTRPSAGKVLLDGVDLGNLGDQEVSHVRNKKIGFVFQFPSLLPTLTVLENVALPAMFLKAHQNGAAQKRAEELVASVGLTDKRDVYPRQLSAGQQQRVVIARALMNQPEIILADEPTSNLDEKTELEIMALFNDLHQRLGITIVLVTHTTQLVSAGMRKIEMASGRILNHSAVPVAAEAQMVS